MKKRFKEKMENFFKHATSRSCVRRAVSVALVVGTVLVLINHCDAIVCNTISKTNVIQIIVTYFVPYSVATYSAAMQAMEDENRTIF